MNISREEAMACSVKLLEMLLNNIRAGCPIGRDVTENALAAALSNIKERDGKIEQQKIIMHLLQEDIADRDKMLEQKVEEVYADFMRDYKAMREELEGCYEDLDELRKKVTSADVVEVVRCRDCKYWGKSEGCVPFQHLRICSRQYGAAMEQDGFCSLGERKEK